MTPGRRSRRPIFVLVPATMMANIGAVFAASAMVPDPAGLPPATVLLFFAAIASAPVGLVSLAIGYAWGRRFVAALLWAFLGVQLAGLRVQPAEAGPWLVFAVFLASNVFALRVVHSAALAGAVEAAREVREARLPRGAGLALVSGLAAVFCTAATIVVLAVDLRNAGGPDPRAFPLLRVALPLGGVLVAAFAIGRLPRSRVPLLAILGLTAVALALHAVLRADAATSGGLFVLTTLTFAVVGLFAATRPAFASFCKAIAARASAERPPVRGS